MPRKFDTFGRTGVITCHLCGHKTRETGAGETNLELDKWCIEMCETENSLSDNGIESRPTEDPKTYAPAEWVEQILRYRKLVKGCNERQEKNGKSTRYAAQY